MHEREGKERHAAKERREHQKGKRRRQGEKTKRHNNRNKERDARSTAISAEGGERVRDREGEIHRDGKKGGAKGVSQKV
jgi:hypothetical protein